MQIIKRWICLLCLVGLAITSCGGDDPKRDDQDKTPSDVQVSPVTENTPSIIWYGDYFNNGYLTEPSAFQRQDQAIAFNWGDSSPDDSMGVDNFSIRWGTSTYFTAGTYRFAVLADDEIRVTLDSDKVLIDTLDNPQTGTMLYADIVIADGEHHLQIDYREQSGAAYAYVNWTQLSEDELAVIDQTDEVSIEDEDVPSLDYIELADWIRSDFDDLPRLQFSELQANYVSTALATDEAATSLSVEDFSPAELQTLWEAYHAANREYTLDFLNITAEDVAAPHHIETLNAIEVSFEESGYVIEVIVWDAIPNMRIPTTIYRPLQPLEERLPVVLTPLGCGSNVATDSVQRRAANLALRGFVVVAMGGFCDNGIIGDVAENHYAYITYANAAGTGQQINSLQLLMWIRMLDYLETRNDVDMSRIGVTGYSNGGGISELLFSVDTRITVAAIVATTLGNPFATNAENRNIFISSQYPAVQSPPHFVYNAGVPSPYDPPNADNVAQARNNLPTELRGIAFLDLSRSQYRVIGRADPGTSIDDHERWLAFATQYTDMLGFESTFALTAVDGDHNYNAERRRLATDWLGEQLEAQSTIQPPTEAYEHETPILERVELEPVYQGFDSFTLHDLFAESALNLIEQRRETNPFPSETIQAAHAVLSDLLLLPDNGLTENQSIQFRRSGFLLGDNTIDVSRWLVALDYDIPIYAVATFIAPTDATVNTLNLVITGIDKPLPSEERLLAWIGAGQGIIILQPPGYGSLTWSQTSRGHHAQLAPAYGYTLLGVGVDAVLQTVDLAETRYPVSTIQLYADGVEISVIAMFAAALDERISVAYLYNSVASFTDFMTSSENPIIPPVLNIPGLISSVDVSDLQAMASDRPIIIESTSDLSEFYPNW